MYIEILIYCTYTEIHILRVYRCTRLHKGSYLCFRCSCGVANQSRRKKTKWGGNKRLEQAHKPHVTSRLVFAHCLL